MFCFVAGRVLPRKGVVPATSMLLCQARVETLRNPLREIIDLALCCRALSTKRARTEGHGRLQSLYFSNSVGLVI